MILKTFFLKIIFLFFFSCNSSNTNNNYISSPLIEDNTITLSKPSPEAEKGECIAKKLSFLIGQPDSALNAMEYPLNTRIMVLGQIVSKDIDPKRLNLVIGSEKRIVFVYCG